MTPEVINGLFGLGGAVLGALLIGGISWYQHKKTKARSELTIFTGRASSLIEVDSSIAELVKITVSDQEVPAVYTFDVTLINSGTETLQDVAVTVELEGNVQILGTNVILSTFTRDPDTCTAQRDTANTATVKVGYLNSSDELIAKVLVSGEPKKITPQFRQAGVTTTIRTECDPLIPSVVVRAMFEGIRSSKLLHAYMKLAMPQYKRYLEVEEKIRT